MPTYVYHCSRCGSDFEVRRKFSDPPLVRCLEGHEEIRRVFTPAGIIFKGSGWYIKDSKADTSGGKGKGKEEEAKESDGEVKSDASATESTASDTTATTSDTKATTGDAKTTTSDAS